MKEHFNDLEPDEHERLSLLMEECAELIMVVGEILRHGYETCHPNSGLVNRLLLERKCGHLRNAMIFMCEAGDMEESVIRYHADVHAKAMIQSLHHQGEQET